MPKCIDLKLGILIHGYELHALNEAETEAFENHLMRCEYCYSQVSEMESCWREVRESESLRSLVERSLLDRSTTAAWRRHLWPKAPLLYRPAFLYFLVLLLLLPALAGLIGIINTEDVIRPVQTIYLSPTRVNEMQILDAGSGFDGLITFAVPAAGLDEAYRVAIAERRSGAELLRSGSLRVLAENGVAELLCPAALMRPGDYRLTVVGEDDSDSLIYYFRIRE